jgi:5'-nucleotidase
MGHAVTINDTLKIADLSKEAGYPKFSCSGTPVDCVKLAVDKILHRKPDLLVSGINHGSNSSVNVIYSGTMSAAVEGAIEGIHSVGFSLCDYSHHADFSLATKIAERVAGLVLEHGLLPRTLLNVNIPKISETDFKGLKVSRQAQAKWSENFDERVDPNGRTYYWMKGEFQILDHTTDTDEWALAHGYASVVPVQWDMTAYHAIENLNKFVW